MLYPRLGRAYSDVIPSSLFDNDDSSLSDVSLGSATSHQIKTPLLESLRSDLDMNGTITFKNSAIDGEYVPARSLSGSAKIPNFYPKLFCLVSTGYMLPWTSICSRVDVYTQLYGRTFFVNLNVVFYAVGLPVSLLSKYFDGKLDQVYKSKTTYMFRSLVSLAVIVALVALIPFCKNETRITLLVGALGIFTWAVHGSQSKLAAVVDGNSSTYQQIGFVFPAVLVLVLHVIFPSEDDCTAYFLACGTIVLLAVIFAMTILRSDEVRKLLDTKDRYSSINCEVNEDQQGISQHDNPDKDIDLVMKITSDEPISFEPQQQEVPGRQDLVTTNSLRFRKHVIALFVIVFCSILEGSFISFVVPVNKKLPIPTILYFVRVFSDLIGRPLTMMKLPKSMKSIDGLLLASCLRVSLLAAFFAYIYVLQETSFRSDTFILLLQFFISVSSGFFIVLIYESAGRSLTLNSQSDGIESLTISFQSACALSSLVSVLITTA